MRGLYDQIVEQLRDKTQPPFRCRSCGGEEFRAWYNVPQGQGITDLYWVEDLGHICYDYDGCTKDADAEGDTEYWCSNCDDNAATLEELVGIPVSPPPDRLAQLREECGYDEIEDTGIDSLIDYKNALEDLVHELTRR